MTSTTYLKGSSNADVFLGICQNFPEENNLKITSAIIKLGVKNIALVLLIRKATETIL